jgi:hypothetical protein
MKGAHVIDSGREPVALIGEWHDDPTEHRLDVPLIAEMLALVGRRLMRPRTARTASARRAGSRRREPISM